MLTPEQLAALLQVSPQTLANWRLRGDGPPAVKVGRLVRYREDQVAMSDDMNRQIASEPDEFAGHTPGDWTSANKYNFGTIYAGGLDGQAIAMVFGIPSNCLFADYEHDERYQVAIANARLIAAAPRLLRENRELRAERDALRQEIASLNTRPKPLSHCPITGRPHFMDLTDERGEWVATYGGPFDSYTIPEWNAEDGEFRSERYDHDDDTWVDGGEPYPFILVGESGQVDLIDERDRLREERLQLMGWLADAKTERDALAETAARLRAALESGSYVAADAERRLLRHEEHDPLDEIAGDLCRSAIEMNGALFGVPVSPAEAAAAERLKGGAR